MDDINKIMAGLKNMHHFTEEAEKSVKQGEFYHPEGMMYMIKEEADKLLRIIKSLQTGL